MVKRTKRIWVYALAALMLFSLAAIPLGNNAPIWGADAAANTEAASSSTFNDVPEDNPSLPFILYLSGQKILTGYPDGKFMPENGLTRAEAATVIARAARLTIKPAVKSPYRDVGTDFWAQAAIVAVTKAGYLKGNPDGRFFPDEKLTRAEGISLVMRLSKQKIEGVTLPALNDVDTKHWAAASIAAALSAGMIDLDSDNKNFLPEQPMTRAEMAKALGVLLTKDPDLSRCSLTGTVTVKKGQVSLLKKGAKAAQTLSDSAVINEGDVLTTGSDGEADISFPDGSGLLVKPNSQMDIKTAIGRTYIKNDGTAGTGIGMLEVNLNQGIAFGALATEAETKETAVSAYFYQRLASLNDNLLAAANTSDTNMWYVASQQPVRVKVDMPWGVCAVRGTFWQNFVSSDGSGETSILTGHADVIAAGTTVSLTEGQQTSSSKKGNPPTPAEVMSGKNKQQWSEVTNWAIEKADKIQKNQGVNAKHRNAKSSSSVTEKINKALKANGSGNGNGNGNSGSSKSSGGGKGSGGGKKK